MSVVIGPRRPKSKKVTDRKITTTAWRGRGNETSDLPKIPIDLYEKIRDHPGDWNTIEIPDGYRLFTSAYSDYNRCQERYSTVIFNRASVVYSIWKRPDIFVVTSVDSQDALLGFLVATRTQMELHIDAIVSMPGEGVGGELLERARILAMDLKCTEITLESLGYSIAKSAEACESGRAKFDLNEYYLRKAFHFAKHCGDKPLATTGEYNNNAVYMSKCIAGGTAAINANTSDDGCSIM